VALAFTEVECVIASNFCIRLVIKVITYDRSSIAATCAFSGTCCFITKRHDALGAVACMTNQ
jgi:hypothetical protein